MDNVCHAFRILQPPSRCRWSVKCLEFHFVAPPSLNEGETFHTHFLIIRPHTQVDFTETTASYSTGYSIFVIYQAGSHLGELSLMQVELLVPYGNRFKYG